MIANIAQRQALEEIERKERREMMDAERRDRLEREDLERKERWEEQQDQHDERQQQSEMMQLPCKWQDNIILSQILPQTILCL